MLLNILMKLYKLIFEEIKFNKGVDQDWPFQSGNNFVIIFDKNDNYKKEGKTHDGISHAIKHFIEFDQEKTVTTLNSYRNFLEANIRKIFLLDISGTIIDNPQIIINSLQSNNVLLNTLDRINDKVLTGKQLNAYEVPGYRAAKTLFSSYKQIADKLIQRAIDTKNLSMQELNNILKKKSVISFNAMFKGNSHKYVYDIGSKILVAFRDNGELNTMFWLGSKLTGYISRNGLFDNKNLEIMLKHFDI